MKEKTLTETQRKEELSLKQQVGDVQKDLATTLHKFENTTEPDLLDYYTYAYKANQIKHSYLLNRLKQLYYS
ncbi:DUF2508 family protein [Candidatus Epulonipiscium viviparus]|uniref:DUF2508 family protein n=1 Tax=Candidatus Epulonipiscium viviparus TaxID=420336 RepID=UPI00016BFC5E|nr:DUF2508 family protein [Candidatus Epulopiscium viviparus]